ncbi:MAG: hypothetical protein WEB30_15250 [Cyclobacteriaceae bacterium]
MKTQDISFSQLREEAASLYNSEKEIAVILSSLYSSSSNHPLNERIAGEAEENRRHCERLEGFLAAADQIAAAKSDDQAVLCDLTLMLKRIAIKHAHFGYKTAIFLAGTKGNHEVANQLRQVLLHGMYKPSQS